MKRRQLFFAVLCATLSSATQAQEPSADFPSKTITLVVPFTASSGSDIITRIVAPELSARWKQPVVVLNRPGASGNLGAQAVATAAPDGHTLLMAINTFTMTPSIYKEVPFDPRKDFKPITQLAETGFAFVINPDLSVQNMKQLMDLVKKRPGQTNYGTPGNGTPQHLAMELFKSAYGLDIMHVPYKGIQGALTDLMAGQVQMMFATVHSTRPLEQAGKVRFIAVTGDGRNPLAPEIPTFKEQGIDVMEGVDAWYGVLAPGGTPAATVAKINKDFIEVMEMPRIQSQLMQQGLRIRTSTPEEFAQVIDRDLARWKKVVTDAQISAD